MKQRFPLSIMLVAVLAIGGMTALSNDTQAQVFFERGGGTDQPFSFDRFWDWTGEFGVWPPPLPNPPFNSWTQKLEYAQPPGMLVINAWHNKTPQVDGHIGEKKNGPLMVRLDKPQPNKSDTDLAILNHRNHTDLLYGKLTAFPPGGDDPDFKIIAKGRHLKKGELKERWSYTYGPKDKLPPNAPKKVRVQIWASFPFKPDELVWEGEVEQGQAAIDRKKGNRLPEGATDFKPKIVGSSQTETRMSFNATVNDSKGEADLVFATQFLAGGAGFFVPHLWNPLQDLFVDVDLTEWVSENPAFQIGEVFNFVAGRNDLLPGLTVYTGLNGPLWDGSGTTIGIQDGKVVVPEPSIPFIYGMGMLGLLCYCRWRLIKQNE